MIEACFSTHHERTVHAVNTLLGVFRNSQLLEPSEVYELLANSHVKNRNAWLFAYFHEISIERAYSFIPFLIACTDDYDIFESIPLTPLSYSWSGSCVPMYSSWVEGLEKLLPILSGLKHIKHKNRVQQLIESYRIRIKEEISDILNG